MLEEILDTLSGYLDDLWKLKGPVYNEERMQSLLEVVGSEIAQLVQSLIGKVKYFLRNKSDSYTFIPSVYTRYLIFFCPSSVYIYIHVGSVR